MASGPATATYDSADRLMTTTGTTAAAWTYDPFGRTTTMATPDQAGTITNAYYVNDQIASQTQAGATRLSWSLDPIGRKATTAHQTWTTGAGAPATTTVDHYATDSDEPSWSTLDTTTGTIDRYVQGLDGSLALLTTATGDRVLQIVDLHGDLIATLPIADNASTATWTGLAFRAFDEFGNRVPLTGAGAPTGPPARYGPRSSSRPAGVGRRLSGPARSWWTGGAGGGSPTTAR